jgi:hypothetical protein
MPDRYGEFGAAFPDDLTSEYEQTASRQADAITRTAAIARCGLCNEDGYIGSTVCDHTDHRAAAKRGMAMIRHAMGWAHD